MSESCDLTYDDHLTILGVPKGAVIINPPVAPRGSEPKNPSIRKVLYNPNTGVMTDIVQYFMDLTKANLDGASNWKEEYRFTSTYGIPDVSAASLHSLLQEFKNPDSSKFRAYYNYYYVSWPREHCSCACKNKQICQIEHANADKYRQCVKDAETETQTCKAALTTATFILTLVGAFFVQLTV